MLIPLFRKSAGRESAASSHLIMAAGPALDAESRISPRHETNINAKLCLLGRQYDCIIQNISVHGMTIALDNIDLCVGVLVLVSCVAVPTLCGTVRWMSHGAYGVQFVKPLALSQVYQMRNSVPAGTQPRLSRARVKLSAGVRFSSQTRSAKVRDISIGGLMMDLGMSIEPGQCLMVELFDMLPIGAHVRWSSSGRCGVMFSKLLPITIAEEIAIRCRLPDVWLEEARLSLELYDAN